MMKRVGLTKFSALEVSRKVQQCLRSQSVNNANGVSADIEDKSPKIACGDNEAIEDKNNLLSAIKKKLRKTSKLRLKCTDGHSENCELHTCCLKSYRTNRKGCIWPVLRSQNHQRDGVTELIPEDPETCSCCSTSPGWDKSPQPWQDNTDPPPSPSEDRSPFLESESNVFFSKPDIANVTIQPISLTKELYKLSKYGWYWGPIGRGEAESKLAGQPDGAFLVRDSSDDRYILSLSFRSYGRTLHTRIEHCSGLFSFYAQPEPDGHASVIELIQQSMCHSKAGVFCYSRSRSPGAPSFPVRLTKPVSRLTEVRSLQYLCRFVIRQLTRYDHIQKLPLPPTIKGYLEEGPY